LYVQSMRKRFNYEIRFPDGRQSRLPGRYPGRLGLVDSEVAERVVKIFGRVETANTRFAILGRNPYLRLKRSQWEKSYLG
jgi:hypothetical protein